MTFSEFAKGSEKQELICVGNKYYIVPPEITGIRPYAFTGNPNIEYLIIPSTVKVIGEHAFEGCKSLKCLIIDEGVVYIERYAFKDCDALETIYLPNSLEKVDITAFGVENEFEDSSLKQVGGDNKVKSVIYNGTERRYYDVTSNLILNIFEIAADHHFIQQFLDCQEIYGPKNNGDSEVVDDLPF